MDLRGEIITPAIGVLDEIHERDIFSQLVSDMRKEFSLSLFKAGEDYSWEELIHLMSSLYQRIDTFTGAKIHGFKNPSSEVREAVLDLFDLTAAINSPKGKKPITAPRVWEKEKKSLESFSGKNVQIDEASKAELLNHFRNKNKKAKRVSKESR